MSRQSTGTSARPHLRATGTRGLKAPAVPFLCTVQLARRAWSIHPTKLPDVCRHLGLKLNHHEALSDAEACANIVLAAAKDGMLSAEERVKRR